MTARTSLYGIETKTRGWHVHLDGVPVGDMTALRKARKIAAERKRRIIQNNDGNDAREHKKGDPWTIENFLRQRTSRLLGSQVDSIFYCSGVFNLYTHRSDETELLARGGKRTWVWSEKLIEMGTDTLEVTADFCKAHDIEVFWSMRMNDTHDSDPKNAFLMPQWKLDHPAYLISTLAKRPSSGLSLIHI